MYLPLLFVLLSLFVRTDEPPATRLILLGTGTPFADPKHQGQAIAIVTKGQSYIFDCGPGVVRQANAAAERYHIEALRPRNLRLLFITHLHSDHTTGYPDIYLTPAPIGRPGPLVVYGPPGTQAMNDHVKEAYKADIDIRLNDLEHGNRAAYGTEVHEIDGDRIVYRDANLSVFAFRVHHGHWPVALGYKIVTPDRTIVLSGDCTYTPAVEQYAKDCDILVHEVYCVKGFKQKTPQMQAYHTVYHTSSTQLAELASRAKPKLLILNHILTWQASEADLEEEMKAGYDGKFVIGRDLEAY